PPGETMEPARNRQRGGGLTCQFCGAGVSPAECSRDGSPQSRPLPSTTQSLRFSSRQIEWEADCGPHDSMLVAPFMEHRWTQLVITLFWLATMTWLTVEKILPPLRRGEPPSFRSVYGNLDAAGHAIGWSV